MQLIGNSTQDLGDLAGQGLLRLSRGRITITDRSDLAARAAA